MGFGFGFGFISPLYRPVLLTRLCTPASLVCPVAVFSDVVSPPRPLVHLFDASRCFFVRKPTTSFRSQHTSVGSIKWGADLATAMFFIHKFRCTPLTVNMALYDNDLKAQANPYHSATAKRFGRGLVAPLLAPCGHPP